MAQQTETMPSPVAKIEVIDSYNRTYDLRKRPRWRESIIHGILFICGGISILTTIGIVYELGKESANFFTTHLWEQTNRNLQESIDEFDSEFDLGTIGSTLEVGDMIQIGEEIMEVVGFTEGRVTVQRAAQKTQSTFHRAGQEVFVSNRVSLVEFFTKTRWNPQIGYFGILPLLNATLMTSSIAMLVALPLGLSTAIYLSEYASTRARGILKPVLEVLAGIPTVVYGYFALTFMTPLLRSLLGKDIVEIYNTASAGIVIGILIIPMVSSMSEDALSAVPRSLREASYSLGATKLETAIKVVVPAAISGIVASFIISISRAIGETMIVAIAAGAGPNFTFNPFRPAETMTGHIVRISGGDLSYDSIDYNSIFAIGLFLFFITLTLNIFSQRIVRRFREVYE